MVTMNVSLPEKMKKRVQERIARGNYANASDYVRDLEASGASKRDVPAILAAAKRARARKRG